MKDTPATPPGWFTPESCNIDDFIALCSRSTTPGMAPGAKSIVSNVPVYDGDHVRGQIAETATRMDLMAEWAQLLLTGPGVFVISRAYDDTTAIDAATTIYLGIIAAEKEKGQAADHFAAAGANDRVWNALQKLCLADPGTFLRYHGNPVIDAACEAWLGPNYQMTSQVNLVHPGGAAQQAHRDYHLGFASAADCARYPAHVHDLSPVMTLQAGIAHVDIPVTAGPTKLLPFSQAYRPGYAGYRLPAFRDFFEAQHVQLPLAKGDAIFFNPALFHAGGHNTTKDIERFVNLLQVSSAFGRAMETVDRVAMCRAVYPVLHAGDHALTPDAVRAAIAATAEGYSFPTNLDNDPPIGGLAPKTQAVILQEALNDKVDAEEFTRRLSALCARQRP